MVQSARGLPDAKCPGCRAHGLAGAMTWRSTAPTVDLARLEPPAGRTQSGISGQARRRQPGTWFAAFPTAMASV